MKKVARVGRQPSLLMFTGLSIDLPQLFSNKDSWNKYDIQEKNLTDTNIPLQTVFKMKVVHLHFAGSVRDSIRPGLRPGPEIDSMTRKRTDSEI